VASASMNVARCWPTAPVGPSAAARDHMVKDSAEVFRMAPNVCAGTGSEVDDVLTDKEKGLRRRPGDRSDIDRVGIDRRISLTCGEACRQNRSSEPYDDHRLREPARTAIVEMADTWSRSSISSSSAATDRTHDGDAQRITSALMLTNQPDGTPRPSTVSFHGLDRAEFRGHHLELFSGELLA
jgi:hypothetical protein